MVNTTTTFYKSKEKREVCNYLVSADDPNQTLGKQLKELMDGWMDGLLTN